MLEAKVQIASMGHKGKLRLDDNQVTVQKTQLKRAEFCLVGFSDFAALGRPLITSEIGKFRQDLESLTAQLGDGAEITVKSPPRIVLDTDDGWKITLVKDKVNKPEAHVSHTGVIERSDGREYSTDELAELLGCLRHFFAFTAGAWRLSLRS